MIIFIGALFIIYIIDRSLIYHLYYFVYNHMQPIIFVNFFKILR